MVASERLGDGPNRLQDHDGPETFPEGGIKQRQEADQALISVKSSDFKRTKFYVWEAMKWQRFMYVRCWLVC